MSYLSHSGANVPGSESTIGGTFAPGNESSSYLCLLDVVFVAPTLKPKEHLKR